MKTITYRFNDGTTSTVEVTDEIFEEHKKLKNKRINNDRQNRRRHISMDQMLETGTEIATTDDEPLTKVLKKAQTKQEKKLLYLAVKNLLPSQRKLLYRVYFLEEKIVDIAEEEGVTHQAICDRLDRIKKNIKKFFV